jgi:hypothetical protein
MTRSRGEHCRCHTTNSPGWSLLSNISSHSNSSTLQSRQPLLVLVLNQHRVWAGGCARVSALQGCHPLGLMSSVRVAISLIGLQGNQQQQEEQC